MSLLRPLLSIFFLLLLGLLSLEACVPPGGSLPTDDDDVTVTLYRGADRLLTDATGLKVMPGGSQRVDYRWGESLIRHAAGRIEDGVLITDPIEQVVIPWMNLGVPSVHIINDMQFRLELSPGGANGIIGGYADVDAYYRQLIRGNGLERCVGNTESVSCIV